MGQEWDRKRSSSLCCANAAGSARCHRGTASVRRQRDRFPTYAACRKLYGTVRFSDYRSWPRHLAECVLKGRSPIRQLLRAAFEVEYAVLAARLELHKDKMLCRCAADHEVGAERSLNSEFMLVTIRRAFSDRQLDQEAKVQARSQLCDNVRLFEFRMVIEPLFEFVELRRRPCVVQAALDQQRLIRCVLRRRRRAPRSTPSCGLLLV